MPDRPLRVLISGGGTGGHIHPALAIAEALTARRPDVVIEFVGARDRMEMERVPAAGHTIIGLPITGIDRKLSARNLLFPFRLLRSLWMSRRIVRRFKPDVAIGVGGFASGPLLWAAAKAGIPTVIQEQNGFPGITNRLLARHVDRVCAGFPGLDRWFPAEKIVQTGNPLRAGLIARLGHGDTAAPAAAAGDAEARRHFGLTEGTPVLLILGGSLGAASMNRAVRALLESGPLADKGFQVLWQCGGRYADEQVAWAAQHGDPGVVVRGFIDRMDLAYDAATLIASRAGAMSIAELGLVGKPTLLVPSPHVAEDHQTKNALSVVDRDGAVLIPDDRIVETLGQEIRQLLDDPGACRALSTAMARTARPDAADRVVDEVLSVLSLDTRG
jgi:UDP-N-acetylglucosamine--N-acetylmuramyl-(pentapeptide) pyrophosphoryl-undecaprenol N-acetylglucosamine transferase